MCVCVCVERLESGLFLSDSRVHVSVAVQVVDENELLLLTSVICNHRFWFQMICKLHRLNVLHVYSSLDNWRDIIYRPLGQIRRHIARTGWPKMAPFCTP